MTEPEAGKEMRIEQNNIQGTMDKQAGRWHTCICISTYLYIYIYICIVIIKDE